MQHFQPKNNYTLKHKKEKRVDKNSKTVVVSHSLQQALKLLRKALFHATSTDLKSTGLAGQISQPYNSIGRQYVLTRWTASMSFHLLPRTFNITITWPSSLYKWIKWHSNESNGLLRSRGQVTKLRTRRQMWQMTDRRNIKTDRQTDAIWRMPCGPVATCLSRWTKVIMTAGVPGPCTYYAHCLQPQAQTAGQRDRKIWSRECKCKLYLRILLFSTTYYEVRNLSDYDFIHDSKSWKIGDEIAKKSGGF